MYTPFPRGAYPRNPQFLIFQPSSPQSTNYQATNKSQNMTSTVCTCRCLSVRNVCHLSLMCINIHVHCTQSTLHMHRVQRSLIFQPALQSSCSQDVLARKFSMFYSAPVNYSIVQKRCKRNSSKFVLCSREFTSNNERPFVSDFVRLFAKIQRTLLKIRVNEFQNSEFSI